MYIFSSFISDFSFEMEQTGRFDLFRFIIIWCVQSSSELSVNIATLSRIGNKAFQWSSFCYGNFDSFELFYLTFVIVVIIQNPAVRLEPKENILSKTGTGIEINYIFFLKKENKKHIFLFEM